MNFYCSNKIRVSNIHLNKTIHDYSFLYISDPTEIIVEIVLNITDLKGKIINKFEEKNEYNEEIYFFIGFKRTILVMKQNSISIISNILSTILDLPISFISDTKTLCDKYFKIKYNLSENSPKFQDELYNFNIHLSLVSSLGYRLQESIINIWNIIRAY